MTKTICPYCNSRETLNIVYNYIGYNKRKNKNHDNDIKKLLKEGTILRNEKKRIEKYDFDGQKLVGKHYNKYCPICNTYFHSIGNMDVIDIKHITLIYIMDNQRHRWDFNVSDTLNYTYKKNYILKEK